MIKLVLTDLDDTLIPFGASRASDRAIRAAHKLIDAGVRFGPMSGRMPASMGWMFSGDDLCYATGGFSNGLLVRIDGRMAHTVTMDGSVLQQVADILDELNADCWLVVYDRHVEERVTVITRREGRARQMLPADAYVHPFEVAPTIEGVSCVKSNVRCADSLPREEMVRVRDALRARIEGLSFVFPSMVAPYIDLAPTGWGKGEAVRYMADHLGISLDEVAVFGDSENDLGMLEAVPNSVAVSNADTVVAQAARWHIGASADDAVAAAMEDIATASAAGELPVWMR